MKKTPLEEVAEMAIATIKKVGIVAEEVSPEEHEWLVKLVALYHDQMSYME